MTHNGVLSLIVAAATIPLITGAAAPPETSVATADTTVHERVSCSSGNFTGEADLTLVLEARGSQSNWRTTVDRYRITKHNGQSGGNKANVDAFVSIDSPTAGVGVRYGWATSPDSMRQDGTWHDLGTSTTLGDVPVHLGDRGEHRMESTASVSFTFDKSGSDPRCVAAVGGSKDFGADVRDVRTTASVVMEDAPITYCKTVTDGTTCSISRNDTASSTWSIDTGLDFGFVKGSLNQSWTSSRAVIVACTSPVLAAGQSFWAYPTATRYDFSTNVRFFGVQARVAPGTAHEVDGGIACATRQPQRAPAGQRSE